MGSPWQTFLAFVAETITQILLTAVALSVLVSDQLTITTPQTNNMPPFEGKCTITSYTTDQKTIRGVYGCSLFLPEMTAIADSLGQTPPVYTPVNITQLNQNIVNALAILVIATVFPIFSVKSTKLHDLAVYIATLAGILAIVALAHAETITRTLTKYSQTASVGDGVYMLVATALLNLYCLAQP